MKISLDCDYSPKPGVVFSKGRKYKVRDMMLRSMNVFHQGDNWYNIPQELIRGTIMNDEKKKAAQKLLDQDNADCWTFIQERTGIKRQKIKVFFFKYWHEIPIPQICKEEKIRAQDVAHMIAVFNEWADADDPDQQ